MTRIPIQDEESADELTREFWAGCETLLGRVPTSMRLYARLPRIAMWMMPFITTLQREGAGGRLDGRTKEIAILKTSMVNSCAYCIGHNTVLAQSFGMTLEQIEALGDGYESSDLLDRREKAVVRWAEAVTLNTAARDVDAFDALKEWFDDDEILELTWVTAMFNMINRIHDTLHLEIEPHDQVKRITRAARVAPGQVLEYGRSILDSLERDIEHRR